MRLLAAYWQAILYAPQHIANVCEGPRAEMVHGQARFVIVKRIAVDLICLIIY